MRSCRSRASSDSAGEGGGIIRRAADRTLRRGLFGSFTLMRTTGSPPPEVEAIRLCEAKPGF